MFKDSCSFSLRVAFEAKQRGVCTEQQQQQPADFNGLQGRHQSAVSDDCCLDMPDNSLAYPGISQLHGEAKEEKSRKKKANETEATCKANRGGKAALQLTYTEGASKKSQIHHPQPEVKHCEDASLHRGHCNIKAELRSRPHIHTNGGKKFSDVLKMY